MDLEVWINQTCLKEKAVWIYWLQTTLAQSQDKSLRRISELKEQTQLDYQAKKDLENNYQLMLDEKDEVIQVLRTQVLHLQVIRLLILKHIVMLELNCDIPYTCT